MADTTTNSGPRPRRARRAPKQGLFLRDSAESDGFSTLDIVNGLNGVCTALDAMAGNEDQDFVHRLAMASKILSALLADRVEL
jgi:hypothetical protein